MSGVTAGLPGLTPELGRTRDAQRGQPSAAAALFELLAQQVALGAIEVEELAQAGGQRAGGAREMEAEAGPAPRRAAWEERQAASAPGEGDLREGRALAAPTDAARLAEAPRDEAWSSETRRDGARSSEARSGDAQAADASSRSERVGYARGEEGTGESGPEGAQGVAAAAKERGGSTGGSHDPNEGSRDGSPSRSPSPSDANGAGPAGAAASGASGAVSTAGAATGDAGAASLPGGLAATAAGAGAAAGEATPGSLFARLASGAPLRAAVRAQVIGTLRLALLSGQREAVVTLDPPELGRLRIQVRVEEDGVRARIQAERPETARMLSADEGAIRDRLAQQGLRLETLVVERASRGAADGIPARDEEAPAAGGDRGPGHSGDGGAAGQSSRAPRRAAEEAAASGRRDPASGGGARGDEKGEWAAGRVDLRA